ncbi:SRPBCC family protein [Phyllobacterium phragmitis]|uniref:SRPBCC family protein n=1 Tax=Phyllobacterium phragmitis TaxID=2670329 RepID=A0ABQ0GX26_9HYPH
MSHHRWDDHISRIVHDPRTQNYSLLVFGVALATGIALGLMSTRRRERHPPDSAPGRTARRRGRFGDYAVVGRTVTIARPRAELYAYWRDFQNLPRFMENIEQVQPTGENQAVWTIAAPGGRTVDVETEVVEDRENELIAWRSVPGSDIETEGRVAFRDAPGGRGTQVEAIVAYKPPAGELGRLVAKLFQREPGIQGRHELKRFKMLMETGEIAKSESRPEPA